MNFSQISKYHWTWLVLILAIVFIDQQSKLFVVERFNVYDRYTLTITCTSSISVLSGNLGISSILRSSSGISVN